MATSTVLPFHLEGLEQRVRKGSAIAAAYLGLLHLSGWVFHEPDKGRDLLCSAVRLADDVAVPTLVVRWCVHHDSAALEEIVRIVRGGTTTPEAGSGSSSSGSSAGWRAVACFVGYLAHAAWEFSFGESLPAADTPTAAVAAECAAIGAELMDDPPSAPCCAALATCLVDDTNSRGLPKDSSRAAGLFERAAAAGLAKGSCGLASRFDFGDGRPKNGKEAVRLWEVAAQQGNVTAQFNLGLEYYEGDDGVPVNYAKAVHWWRLAAEQGDTDAVYAIGRCYDIGRGVPPNLERAKELFEAAAARGQRSAMYHLGLIYVEELGEDAASSRGIPLKALELFRRAAEAGLAEAAEALAVMERAA